MHRSSSPPTGHFGKVDGFISGALRNRLPPIPCHPTSNPVEDEVGFDLMVRVAAVYTDTAAVAIAVECLAGGCWPPGPRPD